MSVKNTHSQYNSMTAKWKRCRDVAAGQDAIHAAGPEYLPMLKDQSGTDYAAYVTRATFYNATWRTISGLLGMLYRKPAKLEVPAAVATYMSDITTGGMPFQVFAQKISEEALVVGRVGVFIDYPSVNVSALTLADAQRLNLRPSMSMYKAESIINWRTRTINNQHVLSMVVLGEVYCEPKNEFEDAQEQRYRVLDLNESNVYRMRVFKIDEKGNDVLLEESIPLMNNQPLKFIPFIFIGVDDITPEIDEPPLIDLVNMNLAHYRVTADYEHGCHFTGLPTAVVSGYESGAEGEKLYIGSTAAWVFPNPDASAKFLEFTGQGLGALEKNLERKEQQMAVLGARMLANDKRAAEAAETAAIHRASENSVLASAAQTLSMGLQKTLAIFCEWANAGGEVVFDLNRDFIPMTMGSQELQALVQAWQAGAISFADLIDNLKKGEIVDANRTAEDIQDDIEAEGPALGLINDTNQ